ncbi:double zinc ribbon domain-containing protein [Thermovibrio sp.]
MGLINLLYASLLDLLFPSSCAVCGSFLFLDHKFVACNRCWEKEFRLYKGKLCKLCGHPLELLPGEGGLCKRCRREGRNFSFDKVKFFSLYQGLVEVSVKALKFDRVKHLAPIIGRTIKKDFLTFVKEVSPDYITTVPVSRKTLKERGFNQTEEILKGMGIGFYGLLEKGGEPEKQEYLSYKERLRNIKGVFKVKEGVNLKEKRVLVFDDVFTTGATASEVARTLKEAGAREVFVYTVAYTPLRVYEASNLVGLRKGKEPHLKL